MKNRTLKRRFGRLGVVALVAATVAVTGCEDFLDIDDRERLTNEQIQDPAVLPGVINGAIGDFTVAMGSGLNDGYYPVSALLSDEFISTGTFPTRINTDARSQFDAANGNTSDGAYVAIQQARRALANAADLAAEVYGTDDPDYITVQALEAYTYVVLAEGFCSFVPISEWDEDANEYIYSAPLTSRELLQRAVDRFNAALQAADEVTPASLMARVGLGRALLDLGQYAEAANAVDEVPTDFLYFIYYSDTADNNPFFSLQANGRYSEPAAEATNGINWRNGDPRTPAVNYRLGFDRTNRTWLSYKYTTFEEPAVLASGVEARLIQAEAALRANDLAGMTAILNDLRDDVWGIMFNMVPRYGQFFAQGDVEAALTGDLAVPADADAARDLLFEERGYWLYLTGHRLGDLRRQIYQYGLTEDEVYPTGDYHKGGIYGDDVVFPLDFDEQNNPEFVAAGGHPACVVTDAGID